MLSAIQSAQFGVPLVRAATTGISAVVDTRGMIVAQTGVFERTALVHDVRKVQVPAPYARLGDAFLWLCVASSVLLLVLGSREPRVDL
jgi:apolipoprotein N-acyltransferase